MRRWQQQQQQQQQQQMHRWLCCRFQGLELKDFLQLELKLKRAATSGKPQAIKRQATSSKQQAASSHANL